MYSVHLDPVFIRNPQNLQHPRVGRVSHIVRSIIILQTLWRPYGESSVNISINCLVNERPERCVSHIVRDVTRYVLY